MALRIYDTFDAKKKELVPVKEGKVGMYMCGMPVQDRPHVGHMLAFVCGDMIRRYLEYKGYEVTYVQNFTFALLRCDGLHCPEDRVLRDFFQIGIGQVENAVIRNGIPPSQGPSGSTLCP